MSLVLHYAMNSSVDADLGLDSSGFSLDATNNTVTSFEDPTYGNVAYFNAASSLVLPSASVPAALQGNTARTISLWMRRITSNNGVITSVGSSSATNARYRLQMATTDKLSLAYYNTTASTTGTLIGTGWRHVALTYTNQASKCYIDGGQEFSAGRSLPTSVTDLGIGEDTTNGTNIKYNGYMVDYRVYDGVLDVTALGVIFSAGPETGFSVSARLYTHLSDITWGVVTGASTYTLRQTEDGGSETTLLETTDAVTTFTSTTIPGSVYVYNMYTELDLIVPAGTVTETAPIVSTVSVSDLLVRISNDITTLTEVAATEIDGELRNALSTGDVVVTEVGNATFVADTETLALPEGYVEKILVPFYAGEGASQTVTITLPDATSEVLTYDDGADEVISGGIQYAVGEYFKSGTYKVTVTEI